MTGRPTYQTNSDRLNEDSIAARFSSSWKCEFVRMPDFYPIDRMAVLRNKPVAWAEIKRRHRGLRQYADVWLSLHKTIYGRQMTETTGLPFLFLVEFNDCFAYAEIKGQYQIVYGGRKDRGDWQDMEPCIQIPVDTWKVLK
jgi:hypothetical protein